MEFLELPTIAEIAKFIAASTPGSNSPGLDRACQPGRNSFEDIRI
jgi:hypothetical protein